ncbi:MAG: IS66 family transposase, partial [Acidobacteriota bacterium]|nr:IS66 family transposase [Acidobacteriota bacterium]
REEVTRLKGLLRYRERQEKSLPFASSTPSSKIPIKANTAVEETKKRGGAQVGHAGHGRSKVEVAQAARVVSVPVEEMCPQCGEALRDKGWRERTVLEMQPVVVEPVVYRLQRKYCEGCRQAAQASAPGVLPK